MLRVSVLAKKKSSPIDTQTLLSTASYTTRGRSTSYTGTSRAYIHSEIPEKLRKKNNTFSSMFWTRKAHTEEEIESIFPERTCLVDISDLKLVSLANKSRMWGKE